MGCNGEAVLLSRRSFSSSHLSMASLMVVDTPGFLSPRHQKGERAATFEEFCHNYGQERLQGLFYTASLESEVGRYREVRRLPCCSLCCPALLPGGPPRLVAVGSPAECPESPCPEACWTLASRRTFSSWKLRASGKDGASGEEPQRGDFFHPLAP